MTLRRRLAGAFGATILGPIVTIIIQLINVPVMLHYWGARLYGEWLLISAIPAYLLLTDLGFGSVAGTNMTMRVHADDKQGAIEVFHSIVLLVGLTSIVGGALLSGIIFLLPIHGFLRLDAISHQDTRSTLFVLCLNCLVIIQWGVITAAYRSAGKYAVGMLSVNVIRMIEGLSVLVLVVWRGGPLQLSLAMLAVSLIGSCWLLYLQTKLVPWLPIGVRRAKLRHVQELWRPAFSYMAFPAGNAMGTQGMTMLIGVVLGPVSVAIFNPMRTLSRPVFQLTDAVKNAVWQELSAAFGKQDLNLTRRLHRSACQVSLLLALSAFIFLVVYGRQIFVFWTHGRIAMDFAAFCVLLAVGFTNSLWNVSSAVALAANRHQRLAIFYLACTSLSLAGAYPLIVKFGLEGASVALLICELAMSVYVVRLSKVLLRETWTNLGLSMIDLAEFRALKSKLLRRYY